MNEPDFPDGFEGAGPMFAAVPLGDSWYALAAQGVTTYIPESASSRVEAAFLDRGQAEAVADASTGGELSAYEGLCGWNHLTNARAGADRQALTELEADPMTGDGLDSRGAATRGGTMWPRPGPEAGS